MSLPGHIAGIALARFARLIAAPKIIHTAEPSREPQVYYANHTSNADTVLMWASMPPSLRKMVRPVAAADYWHTSPLRRFIGDNVFNILPVERDASKRTTDPIADMTDALDGKQSLILFPEGKRNETQDTLLPFKTGLYHLAKTRPQTNFTPVWIENLNGVMPKGEIVPIPLICTLTYGQSFTYSGQSKSDFLDYARQTLLELKATQ